MKRSRRRTLGLTASLAVHALAFAVLTPVALMHVRTRLPVPETAAMQVELVRLKDGLGRLGAPLPDRAEALAPSTPGSPEPPPPPPPPPPDTVPDDTAPVGVVAQGSPLDIDPLFRVPFRDAIGQAEAALRAGLSCAHVDLEQLPPLLLDRCAAADRRQRATRGGLPNV